MTDPQKPDGRWYAAAMNGDRAPVIAALAGLTVISWIYLVYLANQMDGMAGGGMAGAMSNTMAATLAAWSAIDFLLMSIMWWVMMIGMMVPSAAPMILTFSTINQRKRERAEPVVPITVFVAGYLLVWGAFSLAATSAQWGLEQAALLSPTMTATSPILGGSLFIAAGIYQWTPLKLACLRNCRSPLSFLISGWHNGHRGALRMGVEHGAYCLGCCWSIMALLFVGGVMNLLWVAAIAAFVFVEKLFPAGELVARGSGVLMIIAGIYILFPA